MTPTPTRAVLYVTCGMPASGKSTWARGTGCHVITVDAIRGKPGAGGAGTRAPNLFARAHGQLRALLGRGDTVVFDSCALQPQARGGLLRVGRSVGARCVLVFFCVPMMTCLGRDADRAHGTRARVDWLACRAATKAAYHAVLREGWDQVTYVPTDNPNL